MKKKLLLIDGYSIICRGYYALPLLSNKQGQHTNACLGFFNIFYKVFDEEKPQYIAVAFDENAPTFRHEIYKEYKGKRLPMPIELKEQVPYVKDILKSMNVDIVSLKGYEADDILGTLSHKYSNDDVEAIILTGDRDMLQLATTNIKIRLVKTLNNKSTTFNYYEEDVYNEYNVSPTEFIDVKALMGDQSDNIPGVTGVGEKTALSLIQTYNSIENIYNNIDSITKKKLHDTLIEEKEDVFFYKKLVTIVKNAPIHVDINALSVFDIKSQNVKDAFLNYEIMSIYKRLGGKETLEEKNKNSESKLLDLFDNKNDILEKIDLDKIDENITNDDSVIENKYYEINKDEYNNIIEDILKEKDRKNFLFFIEKDDTKFFENIYLIFKNKAYVYSAANIISDFSKDLLKIISENNNIHIYTYNLKSQLYYLDNENNIYQKFDNNNLKNINDISIIRYIINPIKKVDFDIKSLIKMYNHIYDYIKILNELDLYNLYIDIDLPLTYVLYNMEKIGIKINKNKLNLYASDLSNEVDNLEKEIHKLAGEDFNIKSPKQLSNILYNKLNIKYPEKNNKMSTSAEILEKLLDDHPIIEKILTYRTYTKLLDTYAIGLKKYIMDDDRIHTSYNQIETATGRLSSENPNLQNIPIRTEIGKKLRDIFIPRDGYIFIDADYSQIELRILSILSKDKTMIDDFNNNIDIHSSTASKIFNVDIKNVDSLLRRKAKAVNFGLVYGISSFGLGEDLHISSKDAKTYMDAYFSTYKDIKKYLDDVVDNAKNNLYTKTLYNRIRPIYEFKTGNPFQKAFAKRVAMNSPIQGTAADILKIAMISVDKDFNLNKLNSRILLQVHDEILIECKENEIDFVKKILYKNMRDAFDFIIKLEIDIKEGKTWGEAH